jgi:hypothetical protein
MLVERASSQQCRFLVSYMRKCWWKQKVPRKVPRRTEVRNTTSARPELLPHQSHVIGITTLSTYAVTSVLSD